MRFQNTAVTQKNRKECFLIILREFAHRTFLQNVLNAHLVGAQISVFLWIVSCGCGKKKITLYCGEAKIFFRRLRAKICVSAPTPKLE
jgi:hypothetical protein